MAQRAPVDAMMRDLDLSSPFGSRNCDALCVGGYGTIGPMSDHRVRLSDDELDLLCVCLAARLAMAGAERARAIRKLGLRLAECAPGNPSWRFGGEYPIEMATAPKPKLSVIARLKAESAPVRCLCPRGWPLVTGEHGVACPLKTSSASSGS